jgi:hypothetical protein
VPTRTIIYYVGMCDAMEQEGCCQRTRLNVNWVVEHQCVGVSSLLIVLGGREDSHRHAIGCRSDCENEMSYLGVGCGFCIMVLIPTWLLQRLQIFFGFDHGAKLPLRMVVRHVHSGGYNGAHPSMSDDTVRQCIEEPRFASIREEGQF